MALRTITYDNVDGVRLVGNIVECNDPAPCAVGSWTAFVRDADATKRALILRLSSQIDDMVAGRIAEISIVHVD